MTWSGIIRRSSIVFIVITVTATCYAQTAWLQRSWQGRAYRLGSNPQSYDLILTIKTIKGKNFEGIMQTIQPSDPSSHFDTKVSGLIHDKFLTINIGTWKVDCNTCKPQMLVFSIASGRFFLKGEAKGCSVECTWIAEFSKKLIEFSTKEQDILFASAEEIVMPPVDTTQIAQNDQPSPDTATALQQEENSVEPRIPVLAAGSIILLERHAVSLQKPTGTLHKTPTMTIQENTPEKRIPVLAAGSITATENKNPSALSQKTPDSLHKTTSMAIQENVPEKRIPLLATGAIVSIARNNASLLSRSPSGPLSKTTSMTIKENAPEKRIPVLAAGAITSIEHNNVSLQSQKPSGPLSKTASMSIKENAPQRKPTAPPEAITVPRGKDSSVTAQKTASVVLKDTASLLPEGYAERKKNIVRTMFVNTDSILLRVYDNGVVDGDIVSVVYNDQVVVDKLSLTARALEIKIPVKKQGINTLVFHAHNLGEFPPNTAKLEVLYGNKKEELTLSSDFTVSSAIDIEYKQ